ncbi:MAG: hypothetical protein H0X64_06085 [Gemmatimonadaceae bacterium]|nr:hypothetical protein [Gemmatimonadaceae bacterium]
MKRLILPRRGSPAYRALTIALVASAALAAACSPELLQPPATGYSGPDSASHAAGDAGRDRAAARRPLSRVAPRRLALGDRTTCVLDAQDAVLCWGSNEPSDGFPYGSRQVTTRTPVETGVAGLAGLSAGGGPHFCGVDASGNARCWGPNGYGQLGAGFHGGAGPVGGVAVTGGITWRTITVGRISTCGVSTSGEGYCWGNNSTFSVGNDTVNVMRVAQPVRISGGLIFNSVVAGWNHNCGITTSGDAYCWGSNNHGKLGIGVEPSADTIINHRTPKLVAGGHRWVQLASGSVNTCGITITGEAYCWGYNGTGQLGDGTTTSRSAPVAVSGGHRFVDISVGTGFGHSSFPYPAGMAQAGANFTCAVSRTGEPYCWGWNGDGQLGNGSMTDSPVPVAVQGGIRASMIAAGGTTACALDGASVWCWGGNLMGQLGNGTTLPSPSPVRIDLMAAADTLTRVSIAPAVGATYVGGPARRFIATVTGNSNPGVTWTATSPSVAALGEDGLMTPLTAGGAFVTATSLGDGTRSARAFLIVDPAPLAGFTALTDGVDVPVSGTTGTKQKFYIAGKLGMSSLRVQLQGPNGDANLYVYAGNTPLSTMESGSGTSAQRLCVSWLNGSNETCNLLQPEPRIFYVLVDAYQAYSGATLKATFIP